MSHIEADMLNEEVLVLLRLVFEFDVKLAFLRSYISNRYQYQFNTFVEGLGKTGTGSGNSVVK